MPKPARKPEKSEPAPPPAPKEDFLSRVTQAVERTREAYLENKTTPDDPYGLPLEIRRGGSISPLELAQRYYGSALEDQMAAARQYALEAQQKHETSPEEYPFVVPQSYYEAMSQQVPVRFARAGIVAHYDPESNVAAIPVLTDYITQQSGGYLQEGEKAKHARANDLIEQEMNMRSIVENLPERYAGTIEHEVMHSVAPFKMETGDISSNNAGYMGDKGHLALGLTKIQREYYKNMGERLDPQKFNDLVMSLASMEDPEEAMSGYSTEAKRALRTQIKNAKPILKYKQRLEEYNEKLKEHEQLPKWKQFLQGKPYRSPSELSVPTRNMLFLNQSANLIPALVSTGNNEQQAT
jgi:hypothetical protein